MGYDVNPSDVHVFSPLGAPRPSYAFLKQNSCITCIFPISLFRTRLAKQYIYIYNMFKLQLWASS